MLILIYIFDIENVRHRATSFMKRFITEKSFSRSKGHWKFGQKLKMIVVWAEPILVIGMYLEL